jgi:hypothetical protein
MGMQATFLKLRLMFQIYCTALSRAVSGKVCNGNAGNILEAQTNVPDIQHCQGLCQVKFVMGIRATFLKLSLIFQIYSIVKGCVRQSL